jgi:hypothetical protein
VRVLVVGALPPPRSTRSAGLLEAVRALELGGHEVLRLPESAARPSLARLVVSLVRRSRRAEALVLQIEPGPGLPLGAGRLRRTVQLGALSLALRAWPDVELRIDSSGDLPGGTGGRAAGWLWRRASRVVVRSDEQADQLRRTAGLPAGRVEVEKAAPAPDLEHFTGIAPSREAVQALVGRRAAAQRMLVERRPPDAAAGLLRAGSMSLPPSPFGPLEPVVRYAYEHPALRAGGHRVLVLLGRRRAAGVEPAGHAAEGAGHAAAGGGYAGEGAGEPEERSGPSRYESSTSAADE